MITEDSHPTFLDEDGNELPEGWENDMLFMADEWIRTEDEPDAAADRFIAYLESGALDDQLSSRGWGMWAQEDSRLDPIRRYMNERLMKAGERRDGLREMAVRRGDHPLSYELPAASPQYGRARSDLLEEEVAKGTPARPWSGLTLADLIEEDAAKLAGYVPHGLGGHEFDYCHQDVDVSYADFIKDLYSELAEDTRKMRERMKERWGELERREGKNAEDLFLRDALLPRRCGKSRLLLFFVGDGDALPAVTWDVPLPTLLFSAGEGGIPAAVAHPQPPKPPKPHRGKGGKKERGRRYDKPVKNRSAARRPEKRHNRR